MVPREKDSPHFSVHDFEGTRSRIVSVNTDGQEREEDNFGGKQQAVGKECWVRIHKLACLQRRYPYGIRLVINFEHVSAASHCSGGQLTSVRPVECQRQVSAEVSRCLCDDMYGESKLQYCQGSIQLRRPQWEWSVAI